MPTKFPELFNDEITLEREAVSKLLGIFIDKNVTWKDLIIIIFIPRKQLNQLYFSFVHIYLKLATIYCQKKHSVRLLSVKDQFTDLFLKKSVR